MRSKFVASRPHHPHGMRRHGPLPAERTGGDATEFASVTICAPSALTNAIEWKFQFMPTPLTIKPILLITTLMDRHRPHRILRRPFRRPRMRSEGTWKAHVTGREATEFFRRGRTRHDVVVCLILSQITPSILQRFQHRYRCSSSRNYNLRAPLRVLLRARPRPRPRPRCVRLRPPFLAASGSTCKMCSTNTPL